MFPARTPRSAQTSGFPRASGDVPPRVMDQRSGNRFSPRERGCSCSESAASAHHAVFPARAGMFLVLLSIGVRGAGFPRASGDVPCRQHGHHQPPMVFPARAGMFPELWRLRRVCVRFPRASGDVPVSGLSLAMMPRFSPRERGCSASRGTTVKPRRVFPARAGMFPSNCPLAPTVARFPRASGDVPISGRTLVHTHRFSPRERGCSLRHRIQRATNSVFPARAGMFPGVSTHPRPASGFPRASGDVPHHC